MLVNRLQLLDFAATVVLFLTLAGSAGSTVRATNTSEADLADRRGRVVIDCQGCSLGVTMTGTVSRALDREHGLGNSAVRRVLGEPAPGWLEALRARSEAMNRYYAIGKYARTGARRAGAPDWLVALNARSDALNRRYGLGEYAAHEP